MNNDDKINNIKKTKNIILNNNKESNSNFVELNNNKDKTIEKIKKITKYNTDEMNDLSYNLAVNYDKRTFCQYYISLIKMKYFLLDLLWIML